MLHVVEKSRFLYGMYTTTKVVDARRPQRRLSWGHAQPICWFASCSADPEAYQLFWVAHRPNWTLSQFQPI